MNKFETSLLQTLSSIDESLKALAGRKPEVKAPAKKAAVKPAAKLAKPAKKVKKPGNGAVPEAVAKAAEAVVKAAG